MYSTHTESQSVTVMTIFSLTHVVDVFISSRLDYYNSLLFGISDSLTNFFLENLSQRLHAQLLCAHCVQGYQFRLRFQAYGWD